MNAKTSSMKRMTTANISTDFLKHKKSTSQIDLVKVQAIANEDKTSTI
jgi:hypothetical protein